jgi:hypothetical protein
MNDFCEELEALRAGRYEDVGGPASLCEDEYVAKAPFAQSIARILSKKASALTQT